jgi:predicted nucleic acid-binding protein
VWRGAYDLARRARAAGVFVPATDLLIAACARHHQVRLEQSDSDFAQLSRLD